MYTNYINDSCIVFIINNNLHDNLSNTKNAYSLTVSKMIPVTLYGSMLEAGRLSSK